MAGERARRLGPVPVPRSRRRTAQRHFLRCRLLHCSRRAEGSAGLRRTMWSQRRVVHTAGETEKKEEPRPEDEDDVERARWAREPCARAQPATREPCARAQPALRLLRGRPRVAKGEPQARARLARVPCAGALAAEEGGWYARSAPTTWRGPGRRGTARTPRTRGHPTKAWVPGWREQQPRGGVLRGGTCAPRRENA